MANKTIDFDALEQGYQSSLKTGRQIEQPEVLNPSAYAQQPSSSDEVLKGLLELGGMTLGGPIGGKVASTTTRYALPKIAEALSTVPRFLGITEPGMRVVGSLGGAAVGGGAGAVLGETIVPPSNIQAAPDLKSAFLRGAGEGITGEGLGRAAIYGLDKMVLKPMSRYLTGAPKEGIHAPDVEAMQTAEKMGVVLRPAEITGDDVAAQIEQNARRSMFGKRTFQERDLANEPAFRSSIERYADQVFGKAQTAQTQGQLVQDAIRGASKDYQQVNRGLYKKMSDQTGGQKIVDTTELLPQVQSLSAHINKDAFPKTYAVAKQVEEMISDTGYVTGLKVSKRFNPDKVEPNADVWSGMRVTERSEMLPGPTTGLTVKRMEGLAPQGPTLTGEPIAPPLRGLKISERSEGQSIEGPLQRLNVQSRYTKLPDTVKSGEMSGLRVETSSEGTARPKAMDFMEAHDLRSLLLDIGRVEHGLPDRVAGRAQHLASLVDNAMESAAKKYDQTTGKTLYNDWRVANASTKAGHELFDSAVIRRTLNATPEDVAKVGFAKNAQTETDIILRAIRNDKDALNTYRRASLEQLLRQAGSKGYLDGQQLWTAAYGKNGVGEEVMAKTFGEGHADALKKMFDVGRRMNVSTLPTNAGNPSQTGRTLVNWFEQAMIIRVPLVTAKNLMQADVKGAVAEGINELTNAGAYILSIKELSNLLNSTEGLRLLTKGLSMDKDFTKTAAGIRLVINLLSIAGGHAMQPHQATPPTQPSNIIQPPTGVPQAFQPQP